MLFSKDDYKNWDDRASELSDKGYHQEAYDLLMRIYNDMLFQKKRLSEYELYRLFIGLGATSYVIGNHKKALYFYDRIINMSGEYEKLNMVEVAVAIIGKAILHRDQNNFKEAFKIVDDFAEDYNNTFIMKEFYNYYVELAYGAKQYERGIKIGLRAISSTEKAGLYRSDDMVYMLDYLASCYLQLHKWTDACNVLEERLSLIEELNYDNDINWAANVIDCAKYNCYRRKYQKAQKFLEKLDSFEFSDKDLDLNIQNQHASYMYWKAFTNMEMGNLKEASRYLKKCSKVVNRFFPKDKGKILLIKNKEKRLDKLKSCM